MAAFNRFNNFVLDVGLGKQNLNTDTINVYLSAVTPAATMTAKTALAEISITADGGYTGPVDTVNTYAMGTGTQVASGICGCTGSIVWTATGASFPVFQHIVLYNDHMTSPADALIGYWSDTATVDLSAAQTYTVTFADSELFRVT